MAKELTQTVVINGKIVSPGEEDQLSDEEKKSLAEQGFYGTPSARTPVGRSTDSEVNDATRAIDMGEEASRKLQEQGVEEGVGLTPTPVKSTATPDADKTPKRA